MSAPTYTRVSYRPEGGRRKTVILRDATEVDALGGRVLIGTQVNREGSTLDRVHVIDAELVTQQLPMTMNLHYGELEVAR